MRLVLRDLILHMYYIQQIRIFECDSLDRLKKTLIVQGNAQTLRSNTYKDLLSRKVIGFGVGTVENTIDINIE